VKIQTPNSLWVAAAGSPLVQKKVSPLGFKSWTFWAKLQTRPLTLQICPLPKEKKGSTQEETLHRISQTLAEFSFLVEHQSPPKTTLGSIFNVFVELTK